MILFQSYPRYFLSFKFLSFDFMASFSPTFCSFLVSTYILTVDPNFIPLVFLITQPYNHYLFNNNYAQKYPPFLLEFFNRKIIHRYIWPIIFKLYFIYFNFTFINTLSNKFLTDINMFCAVWIICFGQKTICFVVFIYISWCLNFCILPQQYLRQYRILFYIW